MGEEEGKKKFCKKKEGEEEGGVERKEAPIRLVYPKARYPTITVKRSGRGEGGLEMKEGPLHQVYLKARYPGFAGGQRSGRLEGCVGVGGGSCTLSSYTLKQVGYRVAMGNV